MTYLLVGVSQAAYFLCQYATMHIVSVVVLPLRCDVGASYVQSSFFFLVGRSRDCVTPLPTLRD